MLELVVIDVDGNHPASTEFVGDLHDVGADATDADHGDRLAVAQVRAAPHRAIGGHRRAAEDRRSHGVHPLGHRGDSGDRDHAVLGEPTHRVLGDHRAVEVGQPAAAVEELALQAVEPEERGAEVVAAAGAVRALTAGHQEGAADRVPDRETAVQGVLTEFDQNARDLVTEHGRRREQDLPRHHVQVGVTQPARGHLDQHLTGAWPRSADPLHSQRLTRGDQHGRPHGLGNGRSLVHLGRLSLGPAVGSTADGPKLTTVLCPVNRPKSQSIS